MDLATTDAAAKKPNSTSGMNLRIAIAVVASALGGWAGRRISGADLLALFDLLVITAGIVFGVSGAWLALVHAAELRSESTKSGRFRNLTRSMIASGVTITVVLAAHAVHALLVSSRIVAPPILPWLRGAGFGVWGFFALVQVWSLFASLPSSIYALGELESRQAHQKLLKKLPPSPRREEGSS